MKLACSGSIAGHTMGDTLPGKAADLDWNMEKSRSYNAQGRHVEIGTGASDGNVSSTLADH